MGVMTIGTRGSALALWQANYVRDTLAQADGDLRVDLQVIHTKGDKVLKTPLYQTLDKGLFTKELQTALLAGQIDLAVHSLKDLPTDQVPGLRVSIVTPREDPADVLISKGDKPLSELPTGATVLSGSLRRQAQLLAARPDLQLAPVRGNVATRLRRMDESDAAGIVLARAGLKRLDLLGRVTERLDPTVFLPACGQGALAVEHRADDDRVATLIAPLAHGPTRRAVFAERAFLAALGGGCQIPVGAHARYDRDTGPAFTIAGMIASLDGSRCVRRALSADVADDERATALGQRLADEIRAAGGQPILDDFRRTQADNVEGNA